jgi:hypothetical protein
LEKIGTLPALSTAIAVAAWLNSEDGDHIVNDTETISEVRNCLLAQNKMKLCTNLNQAKNRG